MVAASATAILTDINLSTFASGPSRTVKCYANPAKRRFAAGFAHALLTARVNQQVSERPAPGIRQGREEKMFETK
jgi:hypothetical protein